LQASFSKQWKNRWTIRRLRKETTHKPVIDTKGNERKDCAGDRIMTKWITGKALVKRWCIEPFELFDCMTQGLQPYSRHGKKIIDPDSLSRARRSTFEEMVKNVRAKQRAATLGVSSGPALSELQIKNRAQRLYERQRLEVIDPPKDCILLSLTLPVDTTKAIAAIQNAKGFLFSMEDVLLYEAEHSISPVVDGEGSNPREIGDDKQTGDDSVIVKSNAINTNVASDYGENYFVRKGKYWEVGFKGEEAHLSNTENLRYIIHLIDNEAKWLHVSDLIRLVKGAEPDDLSEESKQKTTNKEMNKSRLKLDVPEKDIVRLREMYKDLQIDLAEAERNEDPLEIEESKKALDLFEKEYAKVLTRHKSLASKEEENDRTLVKNQIKRAYNSIQNDGPKGMKEHISDRIKGGTELAYLPDPDNPIEWVVIF
jgi:hypothetical protein